MRTGLWHVAVLLLVVGARAQAPLPITGPADPRCAPLDELMTSFVTEHRLPGAALAVAKDGRLLYARGFGHADVGAKAVVEPGSLFRIASISKPVTAAAVMTLVDRGRLKLDDRPFEILGIVPGGAKPDARLSRVTVRHLLTHSGGWDRAVSGDPMFRSRRITKAMNLTGVPGPLDVVRYVATQPLDFDPGTREAYSNFGYCLLGCVVEKVSGQPLETYVQEAVLRPAGALDMRLGRTREAQRAEGEVRYYTDEPGCASLFDDVEVPNCYGCWALEAMQAHGGWIASAPDLVRFASALGEPGRILSAGSLTALFARPAFVDSEEPAYYAFGWSVRPVQQSANTWHLGSLPGTSALLVRRHDGFAWAALFNSRAGDPAARIDPLIHAAIDRVKEWPPGRPLAVPRTDP